MFADARTVEQDTTVEADLCVVGAGAAGIALALQLDGTAMRVCVLESGALEPRPDYAELNELEPTGLPVGRCVRVRALGGTTRVWAGRWKPHDAIDFEHRPWIEHSGWPLTRAALEPYYARAATLLGLSPRPPDGRAVGGGADRNDAAPADGGWLERTVFRSIDDDRRDFAERFGPALRRSRNVMVLLHGTAVNLEPDADANRVRHVDVRCLSGRSFRVAARRFVLAAGGIENPRLLLLSRSRTPRGLGNRYDQVGRYYMDHPKAQAGSIRPAGPLHLPAFWGRTTGSGLVRVGLALSPAAQRRWRTLNSYVLLSPVYTGAELQTVRALKGFVRRRSVGVRGGRGPGWPGWPAALREAGRAASFVCRRAAARVLGRVETPRRVAVRNFSEQPPRACNRVVLGADRDALGCPRARITWSVGAQERYSLRVLHRLLRRELERRGLGRLRSPLLDERDADWPVRRAASHHMGTTRMGRDPRTSVVDPNGRVHGLANLYVAGSSVFPTSGYANPTATILALTLRLADHIRELHDEDVLSGDRADPRPAHGVDPGHAHV